MGQKFFISTFVLIIFLSGGMLAQKPASSPSLPTPEMQQHLDKAQSFVVSFKKDSALYYTTQLMDEVKERGMMETTFGLRARLAHANTLVLNRQGGDMMDSLLAVSESSSKKELWDVYIEATLLIALLHENRNQATRSLENMQKVKTIIEQYKVDSMYPFYTIQMASYYRIFALNVDSSMYYARETIRTARQYNLPLKEAWGNMLMAMLTTKTDVEAAIAYYRAAARLFLKIDDELGYSYVYNGLTGIHHRKSRLYEALACNDTSIATLKSAFDKGYIDTLMIYQPYKFRATIYHDLGKYDSAYYYLKKGAALEMQYSQQEETAKITEISAKYNDDKRVQQLQQQALQLQLEKNRRNELLVVAFIILLSFSVLVYYFMQLRKANQKNREQAEQLKNMDAAKSRFFANISHELRTPLTLLLGPIKTLLKGSHPPEKQVHLLNVALHSGKQLQQLINEILDLRKLDMGKMQVNAEPTALADFFSSYTAQFESLAQSRHIDFSFETTVTANVVAKIDREKCRQILYNLLSNAFKFTPAGGRIVTALSLNGQILQLVISDTGAGIHPDNVQRVFDRYFQSSRPDRPAEGGTGIGLALCQEYTKLFGGKISVESTVGKGSVFSLEFPVTLADPGQLPLTGATPEAIETDAIPQASVRAKPVASPEETTHKPTILLVEDNPELQDYIRLILEEKYHVITAGNGQEAIELLSPLPPDSHRNPQGGGDSSLTPSPWGRVGVGLILSDLMMPVMDGYQLLEKLKSDDATRHIPVIMLTARAEAKDRLKALRIGVDDYLSKPFDDEELMVRIENLLANHAVRKAVADEVKAAEQPTDVSQPDKEWLENFETYVQKNLSNDVLTVSYLAQEFAMSESTLFRQVTRLTGLSAKQYLQEVRLDAARQLLENRAYRSVSQVAAKVGYSNARTFARRFRERYGKLPTEYLTT